MNIRFRVLLAALLALAALTASTAQASRGIAISQTNITASGNITMTGGMTCDVLINLILNAGTIAKTSRTAFGSIVAGNSGIRNCIGVLAGNPNTGVFLNGIALAYRSFSGVLPNDIRQIGFNAPGFGFLVNTIAGSCLYGGTLDGISFDVASHTLIFPGGTVPRASGGGLCPTTGGITGSVSITTTAPTITLV